jgi:capsular polysaccharide biosynthesis protein
VDQGAFPAEVLDLFRIVEGDLPALRRLRPRLNEMLGRDRNSDLAEELTRYFLSNHPPMTRDQVMLPAVTDIRDVAKVTHLIEAATVVYEPAICLTAARPSALPADPSRRQIPPIDGYQSRVEGFEVSFKYDMPVCCRRTAAEHSVIVPLSSPGHDAIYTRGGRTAFLQADVTLDKVGIIHDHFVGNNYCHWLLDWLPRLGLIQRMGVGLRDLSFIFPRRLDSFQWQTLSALGIERDQIVEVADHAPQPRSLVAFREFVATSTVRRSYMHALHGGSRWAADYLRASFAGRPCADTAPLRLIIDRRATRRLIFSDAATTMLERAGFVTVWPEDLLVPEQIALFSRAERIIGAHGAGLANLVFCKETAHVLEIFPPGYSTPAYRMIAHAIGFEYRCAVGESVTIADALHVRDHDILCSAAILSAWLSS